MTEPRQIAVVRSYDELLAALRARAHELDVSRETLDAITGLQNGYSGKLLSAVPVKTLGRISMGPMLTAMGVALVVIEDLETLQRMEKRLKKRACAVVIENAGTGMPAQKHSRRRRYLPFKGNPDLARAMRAKQIASTSERERKRQARVAAKARWRKQAARKAQ
jgi:hypothetical protein